MSVSAKWQDTWFLGSLRNRTKVYYWALQAENIVLNFSPSMPMLGNIKDAKTATANRSSRSVFFDQKSAHLYLSDRTVFAGKVPTWQKGSFTGEVVFNTGMTGYTESLTDPSYSNQILVFTYPLIGNYGVDIKASESSRIQVSGVVVSTAEHNWSHAGSDRSLLGWLKSQNIPLIFDVDTRALTKHLRTRGTMQGAISDKSVRASSLKFTPAQPTDFEPKIYNKNYKKTLVLVDCGAKENIVRELAKLPVRIKRVPSSYDFTTESYDGVMYSNGPGDPTDYQPTITVAKKALKLGKPVFGICLGSQIMGLAAGATTYKLLFGHRGHNQPCMETKTKRCFVTSQNHGYALEEKSLPKDWQVSFRNLNDNSVEGIEHKSKPFFSVQFHPEACPGPTDTAWLFAKLAKALKV